MSEVVLLTVLFYLPVLLAGGIVIWLGVRGKARWSSPYCLRCRYDLRGRVPEDSQTCPECGADLSARHAIGFVRMGRRWSLVVVGIVIVLMPAGSYSGYRGYQWWNVRANPAPHNLSQQPNATVLQYVQQNVNSGPWGWRELADRIKTGRLSAQEAETAMRFLSNHMTLQSPNGWDQPMHWEGKFLEQAYQQNLIPDATLYLFVDAYHGKQAILDPIDRLRVSSQTLDFHVNYGSTWELSQHAGLPLKVLRHPVAARVDGQPVAMGQIDYWRGDGLTSQIEVDLPPGPHTLEVDMDLALVETRYLVGFNARRSTPKDWPTARRRWTMTATRAFTVLGEAEHPAGFTSEPSLNPMLTNSLLIKDAVVRTEGDDLKLVLVFEVDDTLAVAVSFDVAVQWAGEQRRALDNMTYRPYQKHYYSFSGMEQTLQLKSLGPEVRKIDVILTPNPRHVDSDSLVTMIWGEPITLKDVPLRRYDLSGESP